MVIEKSIDSKKYIYLPMQPGFEIKLENYVDIKLQSNDLLGKTISLFYQFKVNENIKDFVPVVPDGCIDIIFCFDSNYSFANVCGSVITGKKRSLLAGCEYFGVRFLPGQAIKLLNCSNKELTDRHIPLTDIMEKDLFIIEEICKEQDFEARTAIFKNFVINRILEAKDIPNLVEYSIRKICKSRGMININELAEDTGYSTRYLRKNFEIFVGMSPKLLSEIVRFQSSLNMIINETNYDLLDIVQKCGYYDQPHFINEFKKFTCLTPHQIKAKNF